MCHDTSLYVYSDVRVQGQQARSSWLDHQVGKVFNDFTHADFKRADELRHFSR